MTKIGEMLSTPEWWISVVIVGIAVNILSGYVKLPIDKLLSRTSSWWASRSATRAAERHLRVQAMRGDPMLRLETAFWELRFRITYIGLMVVAFGCSSFASWVREFSSTFAQALLFGSCVVLTLAMGALNRSRVLSHEVDLAGPIAERARASRLLGGAGYCCGPRCLHQGRHVLI
jgi:hypothetical protein